jgi:glycine betaine/choline ABC-type transport system substrate-binding protein
MAKSYANIGARAILLSERDTRSAAAVRERVARSENIEVISDVDRKAYRRQLHRIDDMEESG